MFNLLITKNMSRFHNRNFELLEPYDAKVSCTVLRGERGSNTPDLPDKKYYDALRSVNNLVRDARKVQQTVLMLGDISETYVTNFRKMLTDPNFTSSELSAIAAGYTRLLEEANGVLGELKNVVNITTMSMTDKDRMDIVDRCYKEMSRFRNLTAYYTNKNISVSYLRAKKKADTQRVVNLYGKGAQKYW